MLARVRGRSCSVPLIAILLALIVGAVIMVLSSPLIDGELNWTIWITAYKALIEGSVGLGQRDRPDARGGDAADPRRAGGGPRLQGRPVQHRRPGPVPDGRARGRRRRAARSRRASPCVAVTAAVVAALVAGALYGFIPGALKAFTGAHEVVTTIMLNYIAIFIIAYVVAGPLRDPVATFARTIDVGRGAAAASVLPGDPATCTSASSSPSRPCPSCGGCCTAARSASRSGPWAPTRMPRATRACGRGS